LGLTLENFESDHSSELLSKNEYNDYSAFFGPGQFLEYADSRTIDELKRTRISVDHQWQADLTAFDDLQWSLSQQTTESHQKTLDTLNASAMVEQMFRLSAGARVKDYSHEEKSLQMSATFSKTLDKHQLTYGFSTEKTDFDNQINTLYTDGQAPDEAGRYVPFVDATSYGLFIQDQVSLLNDQLTLTPSLRYDSFEATPETDALYSESLKAHDSSNLSFGLGGVYSISDQLSLFAQYAQGFKAPDLYNLYYERDGGNYFTMSNPDLEAEESDSFEFGVRLNNNLGQLEVTAFYNAYDNYIESRFVHDNAPYTNGVTQAQNIAEATIKGLELRSTLYLDEALGAPLGLALETSIAYADGEGSNGDEGDTPLASIAPLTAVFGLNYTSPNNNWGSSLDWTLVAAKEKEDLADSTNMATGGYGTVDLSAYYQPTEALTLRAGLYNLTDKKYWVYEDVRGFDADKAGLDRYTQPGRNLGLSANYAF
jgi:hemoglobin/transferrin/lactoferrin receptor protein